MAVFLKINCLTFTIRISQFSLVEPTAHHTSVLCHVLGSQQEYKKLKAFPGLFCGKHWGWGGTCQTHYVYKYRVWMWSKLGILERIPRKAASRTLLKDNYAFSKWSWSVFPDREEALGTNKKHEWSVACESEMLLHGAEYIKLETGRGSRWTCKNVGHC